MGKPVIPRDDTTVDVGRTRGTETSQYPQEEKVRTIAQVVASERAGAQTVIVSGNVGVVGPPATGRGVIAEHAGKRDRSG